jgi:hypothetical protein
VASFGERPSSLITRSTFSTTTMASSTSRPIASTMPNMVSVLIEKPKAAITPKVPSSTTGTAMVGISVARKFCRNRYITRKTSTTASISVLTTFDGDLDEGRGVVGHDVLTPAGKKRDISSSLARTAVAVSSALAPRRAGWRYRRRAGR